MTDCVHPWHNVIHSVGSTCPACGRATSNSAADPETTCRACGGRGCNGCGFRGSVPARWYATPKPPPVSEVARWNALTTRIIDADNLTEAWEILREAHHLTKNEGKL